MNYEIANSKLLTSRFGNLAERPESLILLKPTIPCIGIIALFQICNLEVNGRGFIIRIR